MNPALSSRRDFIRQVGVAATATLLPSRSLAALSESRRPAATLDAAYRDLGFNPSAGDAFTAVWMADVHYGVGQLPILPPIISEIAGMNPRPALTGIIGDLVKTASLNFGRIPTLAEREKGIAEFRELKPHVDELAALTPVKLTLGNHDTYPGERDAGIFRAVFSATPITHAFNVKGVSFLILNGGNCGLLGSAQETWYREQVKRLHQPGGTLVTSVHQPSLGRIVRERGITAAARNALEDVKGDLWLVGGHEHKNEDVRFLLPHGTAITQSTITAANPTVWGTERPGYWIWCFKDGRLVGRIFRKLNEDAGYSTLPVQMGGSAKPLLLPFEGRDDVLWKVMVGEGDEPYRRITQAAWCLNYWHRAKPLEYEFPLRLANSKARRGAVLVDSTPKDHPFKLAVSANGRDWRDLATTAAREACVDFEIPGACHASGMLSMRLEDCAVSGFALLS